MKNQVTMPIEMRLIYLFRHLLQRQDLFVTAEQAIRTETEKQHIDSPSLSPIEITRIIDVNNSKHERPKQKGFFATPFIVKGACPSHSIDWPTLRDVYGKSMVPVHPDAQIGPNWQYQSTYQMRLDEAMRAMERGATISVVSTSQVFVDHVELLAKLTPQLLAARFGVTLVRPEMFVAGSGTGSAFHCHVGGTFFQMIYGRKHWTLVSSEDSFAMYPTVGRNSGSAIFCSPINAEAYERDQQHLYPLYGKVNKYAVTLEPGDILYIPSLWWHEVRNIGPTIGVPLRIWGGRNPNFFFLLTILSRHGLKHLPKAFIAKLTGNPQGMMTDGIPQEALGGSRPRASTSAGRSSLAKTQELKK